MRRTTLAVHGLRFFLNAGRLSQLARSVFDGVNAIVQVLQLLPLLIVLGAQARVLVLDADVFSLLRQSIKTVKQSARNGEQHDGRDFQPTLMDADATDMGS